MEALPSRRMPEIDYLAKDYASFRQLLLDQLSLLAPDWQERSPADLGQALVEVLAYAADYLSYYQDAVATETYLGTARLRRSVRRHARLLDYHLHEGCNARTWIYVEVNPGQDLRLPAGTVLLTRPGKADTRPVIGRREAGIDNGPARGLQAFETMHGCLLSSAYNAVAFYVEGREDRVLARGATTARLQDNWIDRATGQRLLDGLKAGDVLLFEEVLDPSSGQPGSSDPTHRHVVRLTDVTRSAAEAAPPYVSIAWDAADALPFDLVVGHHHVVSGLAPLEISVARGNLILADHGWRIADEPLPPRANQSRYRPYLFYRDVTYAQPYDHAAAVKLPASSALQQDLQRAQAAVQLTESQDYELAGGGDMPPLLAVGARQQTDEVYRVEQRWTLRQELLSSEFYARHYVVESEEDGRAYLRFGFGGLGKQPSGDSRLSATYRVGNGTQGNVGRETITHLVSDDPSVVLAVRQVRNPLPVSGGTNPERIEAARLNAPQAFKTHLSCITAEDYVALVLRHPAIRQAQARVRATGSWTTAQVYVQRGDGQPVDEPFRRAIEAFLQPLAMSGHQVVVSGPRYVGLDLRLRVRVQAGYFRLAVRQAVEGELSNGLLPDGRPGFFHPDNLMFGQPIYRSQVVSRVMAIAGVAEVEIERFGRLGETGDDDPIPIAALEIARLDNDPARPENGSLRLVLEGGK